jgi:hypothetical protein
VFRLTRANITKQSVGAVVLPDRRRAVVALNFGETFAQLGLCSPAITEKAQPKQGDWDEKCDSFVPILFLPFYFRPLLVCV